MEASGPWQFAADLCAACFDQLYRSAPCGVTIHATELGDRQALPDPRRAPHGRRDAVLDDRIAMAENAVLESSPASCIVRVMMLVASPGAWGVL